MTEHDGCTGCKYFEKYKGFAETTSEMPCFDCEMAHSQNILKDKYEPMTNADRIRSMSDEELKEFLKNYEYNQCDFCNKQTLYHCDEECPKHILGWLQSEAKESEEE